MWLVVEEFPWEGWLHHWQIVLKNESHLSYKELCVGQG